MEKRIRELKQTATEADLISDNYFGLDCTNVTKKLTGDIIARRSVQDNIVQSIAPIFDPANGGPNADGNYPAGYIVTYNGVSYIFKVAHSGAWNSSDVMPVTFSDTCMHSTLLINDKSVAESIFGNARDVGNASKNTICNIGAAAECTGLPTGYSQGTLITLSGNAQRTSTAKTQIFLTTTNWKTFVRTKWGDSQSNWKELIGEDDLPQYQKVLSQNGFINDNAKAVAAFGDGKDVKNAVNNTMYGINEAYVTGLPETKSGTLITYNGSGTSASAYQIFVTVDNKFYHRTKWSSTWKTWVEIPQISNLYADNKFVRGMVVVNTESLATTAFGNDKNVANADKNTVYSIAIQGIVGLPSSEANGVLITMAPLTGAASFQIFASSAYPHKLYHRIRWGQAQEWQTWRYLPNENTINSKISAAKSELESEIENVEGGTNSIPAGLSCFYKIGACGGSITTGVTYYKDSQNENHSVQIPENSWVQFWARKHGTSGFNFSSGGYSVHSWLTQSEGLTKASIPGNECMAYFCMFGGHNDNTWYEDHGGLGTISDVNVGSEQSNPASFYGDLSKMIAAIKNIAGQRVRIFFFTYARGVGYNTYTPSYTQAIKDVAALYSDVIVFDMTDDTVLNGTLLASQKYEGHFSAYGYKIIADRYEFVLNKYMKEHASDFDDIQWIGTNYDVANT